jgi:hypothetical protein
MRKALLLTFALVLTLSACAWAGLNPAAKAAVHVRPHASGSCTKNFPTIDACDDVITTDPGVSVDAFPVFFDLVEYQGFDYGLTFVSGYSATFASCSDLTIGNIVNSGDGISHAWYVCQYGAAAVCGFGWLYSYGIVCIVPHPAAGGPTVGDCHGGDDGVVGNFCAGTNGVVGDDPCEPIATDRSTWGSIKGMFK